MEVEFFGPAIDDYEYWQTSGNLAVQKKINQLFTSMLETPFEGLGKPEALRHNLSGKWSRRINQEHRIVYSVDRDIIRIYSLRGHY